MQNSTLEFHINELNLVQYRPKSSGAVTKNPPQGVYKHQIESLATAVNSIKINPQDAFPRLIVNELIPLFKSSSLIMKINGSPKVWTGTKVSTVTTISFFDSFQ